MREHIENEAYLKVDSKKKWAFSTENKSELKLRN
jgi:hypothetical protein